MLVAQPVVRFLALRLVVQKAVLAVRRLVAVRDRFVARPVGVAVHFHLVAHQAPHRRPPQRPLRLVRARRLLPRRLVRAGAVASRARRRCFDVAAPLRLLAACSLHAPPPARSRRDSAARPAAHAARRVARGIHERARGARPRRSLGGGRVYEGGRGAVRRRVARRVHQAVKELDFAPRGVDEALGEARRGRRCCRSCPRRGRWQRRRRAGRGAGLRRGRALLQVPVRRAEHLEIGSGVRHDGLVEQDPASAPRAERVRPRHATRLCALHHGSAAAAARAAAEARPRRVERGERRGAHRGAVEGQLGGPQHADHVRPAAAALGLEPPAREGQRLLHCAAPPAAEDAPGFLSCADRLSRARVARPRSIFARGQGRAVARAVHRDGAGGASEHRVV